MSFCQASVDLCLFALLPYGSREKGAEGKSVKFPFDNCSKIYLEKNISDVTALTKTMLLTAMLDIFFERGSKLTIVTFETPKSTV